MTRKILFILGVVILIISKTFVLAETIILKSGQKVEGKIIEKTDKYIKIDFQGVSLTYNVDEIASIEKEVVAPLATRETVSGITTGTSDLEKYTTESEQCFLNEKYEDTITLLKKIILLKPEDSDLQIVLGILYYYAGNLEESIATLQKALSLAPNDPEINLYLSIVYDSKGDGQKAKELLSKIIEQYRKEINITETFIAETLLKKINNK